MINFHPRAGTVLACDFSGYRSPEIVKTRPVVIVSPLPQVAIVVPFSLTKQIRPTASHYRMPPGRYPFFDHAGEVWAKGELVAHVSYARLDRLKFKSQYIAPALDPQDFRAIKNALAAAIGLPRI